MPNSPNANTQTRQIPTPRRNVIPGQQRSAAVHDRNALRQGVTGTISSINGNTLTFNSGSGTQTLSLTPDTQVQLNGQNVSLSDLPPNASVQVFTNPSNPTEIQRIVATTDATGSTQGGTTTGGTTTGGTTTGGTLNPDGTITTTEGVTTNPDGTTIQPTGREAQADPRRGPDQPFLGGSNQTTTGSQNRSGIQRPGAAQGQMNNRSGAAGANSGSTRTNDNLSSDVRGRAGMTNGQTTDGQTSTAANLGMTLQSTNRGVLVSNVASGGVAARGSLQQGDVITAINGQTVSSPRDVNSVLNGLAPNSSIQLQILRNGQTMTQTVTTPAMQQSARQQQQQAPRTAEQIAEENRALQAEIDAARNREQR